MVRLHIMWTCSEKCIIITKNTNKNTAVADNYDFVHNAYYAGSDSNFPGLISNNKKIKFKP